jgi:hypothetical protein
VAARALSIAAFEAVSLAIADSCLIGWSPTSQAAASYQASRPRAPAPPCPPR